MATRRKKISKASQLVQIWADFVYGAFHNPRTTITALGLAIPILYKAYELQSWHLVLTGIGTLLNGLFAKDAQKETQTTEDK